MGRGIFKFFAGVGSRGTPLEILTHESVEKKGSVSSPRTHFHTECIFFYYSLPNNCVREVCAFSLFECAEIAVTIYPRGKKSENRTKPNGNTSYAGHFFTARFHDSSHRAFSFT